MHMENTNLMEPRQAMITVMATQSLDTPMGITSTLFLKELMMSCVGQLEELSQELDTDGLLLYRIASHSAHKEDKGHSHGGHGHE